MEFTALRVNFRNLKQSFENISNLVMQKKSLHLTSINTRTGFHTGFFEKGGGGGGGGNHLMPPPNQETVPITNVLTARIHFWKNYRCL